MGEGIECPYTAHVDRLNGVFAGLAGSPAVRLQSNRLQPCSCQGLWSLKAACKEPSLTPIAPP